MRVRGALAALAAVAAASYGAGDAWAGPVMLGGLAPSGATLTDCKPPSTTPYKPYRTVDQQSVATGGPTYVVPPPGGTLMSWSAESSGDPTYTGDAHLVILSPGTNPNRTVFTMPGDALRFGPGPTAQKTASGPHVFLNPGDEIALAGVANVSCAYATGAASDVYASALSDIPTDGTALDFSTTSPGRIDVAAVVNTDADVSLTSGGPDTVPAGTQETRVAVGGQNNGPSAATVTITGDLPSNLQLVGATMPGSTSDDPGTCTVTGQHFSCSQFVNATTATIPGRSNVPTSAGVSLDVRLLNGQGGAFTATATSDHPDPNPMNNSFTEGFGVQPGGGGGPGGPTPMHHASGCRVPKLAGRSLSSARRALKRAHCRLGRVVGKAKRSYVVVSTFPPARALVPSQLPVSVHMGKKHKVNARPHR